MAGKLVTIATFAEASQAHIARNALEAAGIPVTLNNEESFGLFGQTMAAMGGIQVVVREEDEPAAVKVLDDTFGPDEQVSEEDLAAQAEAAEPEDAREFAEQAASAPDPTADSAAREKDARVAFQAAAISLIMPVAVFSALPMIRRAASGPGELSPRGRWNLRVAIALSIGPLFVLGLVVLFMVVMAVFMLLSPWLD